MNLPPAQETPTEAQALLGAMLRAEREGVGLQQSELARRVGVSAGTISRFETGKRIISPELRARITRVIADEFNAKRSAA
jgi:transcriptional regulator with XRE-family HTH domain